MRRTRVVATLGPASSKPETLRAMVRAGVDVIRVNYSHGTHDEHEAVIRAARAAADAEGRHVAILQDLQGVKLRLGRQTPAKDLAQGERLAPDTLDLPNAIREHLVEGTRLILGDGAPVLSWDGAALVVQVAGGVRAGQGVTAPDLPIRGGLTAKDQQDLLHGRRVGVDWVALSFVGSPDDVLDAREFLAAKGEDVPILAKIERAPALDNLPAILRVCDGLMVARGDLGLALPLAALPAAQKRMLGLASRMGKVSITATQMLESMLQNPIPTRAEVTDVANAILDGTDAVMLSGETAVGKHPVEAVRVLAEVAATTEDAVARGEIPRPPSVAREHSDPVAHAAAVLAEELQAKTIVAFTQSGATAARVAAHRPTVPVLALTPEASVVGRLQLVAGVLAVRVPVVDSLDALHHLANQQAKALNLARPGDDAIVVSGELGVSGTTSTVRVLRIR